MGLLKMMWGWLKGLAQLLVAPAAKIRALPGIRPILRWILHFVLLALVLAGLGALNYFLDLGQAVRAPRPWLGQVWLPLLFLLLYGLGWLVWWMIHLLSAEEAPSPFPDIDLAWKDACVALEKAGIDPSRLPLFLVLGRSAGQELSVFQAARIPLVVSRAPRELDAPLHVFASEEGVYVTCGGASLLAEYARILTREESDEEELLPAPAPREKSPPPAPPAATPVAAMPAAAAEPAAGVATQEPPPGTAALARPPRRRRADDDATLLKAEEVERLTARLRRVCELIRLSRRPYCPVNGLVVLTPARALQQDDTSQQAAALMQQDLLTVRGALQLRCPLLAIVTDVETLPGGRTFLERIPPARRDQRLGVPFPYLGEEDRDELSAKIEEATTWMCQSLFPGLIYRVLRVDATPAEERLTFEGNRDLHRLAELVRESQRRLSRALTRGLLSDRHPHWYFAGCYFAATGPDAERDQGFLAEVFPTLLRLQELVSWTEEARADDDACRRLTRLGYLLLVLFVAGMLALCWWLW